MTYSPITETVCVMYNEIAMRYGKLSNEIVHQKYAFFWFLFILSFTRYVHLDIEMILIVNILQILQFITVKMCRANIRSIFAMYL